MNRDDKILKHLQRNELNKAATLLYGYYDSVSYHAVLANGGTEEDAKDIFQEAVLVLLQKVVDDQERINCSLKTYLTTVCRYQWNNKRNKLNFKNTTSSYNFSMESAADESKDFESEEAQFALIEKALNSIGDKCKNLLQSFYLLNQSMEQIAQKFGFASVNSAKTQKYKCIERARAEVMKQTELKKVS
ncbi:sigma-70 family RNA polymerase sigma factor [bacterium]|nr:sigma-70 family RNA polymerase sigma factor [bacterium]